MAEYRLHCFAQSGNAYKVALMLAASGCDWEPVFVDYFNGVTRTPEWRDELNAMGEVPVLEHDGKLLRQSGVILDYLAQATGKFAPQGEDERREVWRWMLFDNHKFTSYYATLRFLVGLQKSGENELTAFLRARSTGAYDVVEAHLADRDFMLGGRPTIADLSLAGYVFMPEETGMDAGRYPRIAGWKARLMDLPGWQHPYDLMPGAPESWKGL